MHVDQDEAKLSIINLETYWSVVLQTTVYLHMDSSMRIKELSDTNIKISLLKTDTIKFSNEYLSKSIDFFKFNYDVKVSAEFHNQKANRCPLDE